MNTYDRSVPMRQRPLAFTDFETTGLEDDIHEIIEIGLVVTTPQLEIIDELDIKVQPVHIETAEARALEINGYTPEKWLGAISLKEGIQQYSDKTVNALFVAHNIGFDWGFLKRAFNSTGVANNMDYHRPDNFSIAWHALKDSEQEKFNQDQLAIYYGLEPEPPVHRAINGARLARQIYGKMMEI